MINVAELMSDPDFSTHYRVVRKREGGWNAGRFEAGEEVLDFYGPVQPAGTEDLEQFDTGDRDKGIMKFMCAPPSVVMPTDFILYNGKKYKILRVAPWSTYGFCRAFGVLVGGADDSGSNQKY